ncbi:MAG: response regulator [Chloroflexales bacterium]|nr:response regulator [Chloroflexales bacterium]
MLSLLYRKWWYPGDTTQYGAEAVAQVHATRPDVAVLDIQMPALDGLSVIRRIRADPAVAATLILAVTALTIPGDRERCLEAGATRYLAKPVSCRQLVATLAEVLASPEAT